MVIAGDYNIVPEPRDIYPTTSYDDALVQPKARAATPGCWLMGGTPAWVVSLLSPDREVRGLENASDHAPVWAKIG